MSKTGMDIRGKVKKGWQSDNKSETLKTSLTSRLPFGGKKDGEKDEHVAAPLSSLRDPSSFGPPPKQRPGQLLPPPKRAGTSQGAPPSYDSSNRYATGQEEDEEDAPPPKPYRANTTGLDTTHLPPPPGRKDGADGRSPPPQPGGRSGPPSLPPRLPPRSGSGNSPATSPTTAAPAGGHGGGYLNQGAMSRLGAAGISVPAFGIGKQAPTSPVRANDAGPPQPPRMSSSAQAGSQMNELQNRFSRLGKSSGQSATPPPAEGTTTEQKQAALRTASNFHKDPSSVSMTDARSAASTFNNFRQRHGDQVAAGAQSANSLNQKYGLADKVGAYTGRGTAGPGETSPVATSPSLPGVIGKKKPPPPPPKKKPQLGGAGFSSGPDDGAPPPIPLSTRPQF